MGCFKKLIPNKISERYNKWILANQTEKLHKDLTTINLANQLENSERQRLRGIEKDTFEEVTEKATIDDKVHYSKVVVGDKLQIADQKMREKFSVEKDAFIPKFRVGEDGVAHGGAHSKVSFTSETKKPKSLSCRHGIQYCQCDITNDCIGIQKLKDSH